MKKTLLFLVISLLSIAGYSQLGLTILRETYTKPDTIKIEINNPNSLNINSQVWTTPGGVLIDKTNNYDPQITIVYNTPGKYSIGVVIDTTVAGTGTSLVDTIFKNAIFVPGILTKEIIKCYKGGNDTVQLEAAGGYSYNWLNGGYDSVFTDYSAQSAYYKVTISNDINNTKTFTDSVRVIINTDPNLQNDYTQYCLGDKTALILPNFIKTYSLFSTTDNSIKGPFSNSKPYYFTSSEQYNLKYTDTLGCNWNSVQYTVGSGSITKPLISLTDQTICKGSSALFDLSGNNYRFEWYKNDSLKATSNIYEPIDSGTYVAKVFNGTCFSLNNVNVNYFPSKPELITSINYLPGIGYITSFSKSSNTMYNALYHTKGSIIDSSFDGANQSYRKLPYIIDTTTYSETFIPSYFMASYNNCNQKAISKAVSPVLLLAQRNTDGNVDLSWEPTTVKKISTYYVFRGKNPDDMKLLTSLSSSNLSFTDLDTIGSKNAVYAIGIKDDENIGSMYSDMMLNWQPGFITSNISPQPVNYHRIGVFAFLQSDKAGSTVYFQSVASKVDSIKWLIQDTIPNGGNTIIIEKGKKVNHTYITDGVFDVKVYSYIKQKVDSLILPRFITIGNPLISIIDTIYKSVNSDTLKIDIASSIKNAVSALSTDKVTWSIVAPDNSDIFASKVTNTSNTRDSLLVWVNPTTGESSYTLQLTMNFLKTYTNTKNITIIVSNKTNEKPTLKNPIPEQIANMGKKYKPLSLQEFITDDFTQFKNLKFSTSKNADFAVSVIDGYLYANQIDGTFTGTTEITLTVTDEDTLSSDFVIHYVQPFLVNVPDTLPSASFNVNKRIIKPFDEIRITSKMSSTDTVLWNFDGGIQKSGSIVNPIITYNKPGLYSISLIAKNQKGIAPTKPISIIVSSISPLDTTICKGDSITLSASTSGFVCTWLVNPAVQSNSIKVSPKTKTTYKVSMTKGSGKTAITIIDSITVALSQQPNLGKDTSFCEGSSYHLNAGSFSSYFWNANTAANQSSYFDASVAGNVSVKTIDNKGCIATDTVKLSINKKPVVSLGSDITFCWSTVTKKLDAGNSGSSYIWSTGKTTQTIVADTTAKYSVTVTTSNKCIGTGSININVLVPFVPQIGLLTQSESGNNLIAWEAQTNKRILKYNVWKLSSNDLFDELVSSVGKDSLTIAIDKNSNPKKQAYSYALSTVDSACNTESAKSPFHSSIHLSCILQNDTIINATWNKYEGLNITRYYISRAFKGQPLALYDSIDVSLTEKKITYTDKKALGLNSYYQVSFNLPKEIKPSRLKSDSGPFSQSLSNMAESELTETSVLSSPSSQVSISPNPAKSFTTVKVGTQRALKVSVINLLGQTLQTKTGVGSIRLDCSSLYSGMYILEIESDGKITSQSLIVE